MRDIYIDDGCISIFLMGFFNPLQTHPISVDPIILLALLLHILFFLLACSLLHYHNECIEHFKQMEKKFPIKGGKDAYAMFNIVLEEYIYIYIVQMMRCIT